MGDIFFHDKSTFKISLKTLQVRQYNGQKTKHKITNNGPIIE